MTTSRLLASVLGVIACVTSPAAADLFVAGYAGPGTKVGRYDQNTGAFLGYLDGGGEAPVGGIGIGPDHQLYVTGNVFGMGQMSRVTGPAPGLVVQPTFQTGPTPDHSWTNPHDAGFGADGAMYVTSNFNSSYGSLSTNGILKYATDGTYLGKFADTQASYVTFGPGGDLFVNTTYSAAGDIKRYRASDGVLLGTFVGLGSGGLTSPSGIAFGPDGNFYVGDFSNSRVLKYDGTTGAFINVFVASGSGGLHGPNDITFGPDANLYAGSTLSVLRYNGATGNFMNAFVPSTLPFNGGQIQPGFMAFGDVPEPSAICALLAAPFALARRHGRRRSRTFGQYSPG